MEENGWTRRRRPIGGGAGRPEQGGGQGSAGRLVSGHRRGSCQWRGSPDCGIPDLRHQKQVGPYRTQPEGRRDGFDIGVGIANIQGREDAEGCSQCRSRFMTLQHQPNTTGDDSERLHVEFNQLLCDDGYSASCRDGAGKTQDSREVDGWTATGLDAASRMRQIVHGGAWKRCKANAAAEGSHVEIMRLGYDNG